MSKAGDFTHVGDSTAFIILIFTTLIFQKNIKMEFQYQEPFPILKDDTQYKN